MKRSSAICIYLLCGSLFMACGGGQHAPASADDEIVPLDDAPVAGTSAASTPAEAPASPEVRRGIAALESRDFRGAVEILTAAEKQAPKDAQAAYYLGVAKSELGDKAEAVAAFERSIKLDPKLLDAYVNLSALELDLERADRAEDAARRGLAIAPKHPDLALNRAIALEALGRGEEALTAYGVAVELAPQNLTLRVSFAQLLARANRKPEALAQVAAVRESDDPKLLTVAAIVARQLGAFADCVAVLDRAQKLGPNPGVFVRRGMCREDLKDLPGATRDYQKALDLDANFAPAHFYLGLLLRSTDKPKACEKLERAKKLALGEGVGPEAEKALRALGCP